MMCGLSWSRCVRAGFALAGGVTKPQSQSFDISSSWSWRRLRLSLLEEALGRVPLSAALEIFFSSKIDSLGAEVVGKPILTAGDLGSKKWAAVEEDGEGSEGGRCRSLRKGSTHWLLSGSPFHCFPHVRHLLYLPSLFPDRCI